MSPYQVFAEAAKADPSKSFRDLWVDFAVWETARGYYDDPSGPSKDALEWVRTLDELVVRLDDFDGADTEQCQHALEAAFVAFARMKHSSELCSAVRRWRKWRLAEAKEKEERLDNAAIGVAHTSPQRQQEIRPER